MPPPRHLDLDTERRSPVVHGRSANLLGIEQRSHQRVALRRREQAERGPTLLVECASEATMPCRVRLGSSVTRAAAGRAAGAGSNRAFHAGPRQWDSEEQNAGAPLARARSRALAPGGSLRASASRASKLRADRARGLARVPHVGSSSQANAAPAAAALAGPPNIVGCNTRIFHARGVSEGASAPGGLGLGVCFGSFDPR